LLDSIVPELYPSFRRHAATERFAGDKKNQKTPVCAASARAARRASRSEVELPDDEKTTWIR